MLIENMMSYNVKLHIYIFVVVLVGIIKKEGFSEGPKIHSWSNSGDL